MKIDNTQFEKKIIDNWLVLFSCMVSFEACHGSVDGILLFRCPKGSIDKEYVYAFGD